MSYILEALKKAQAERQLGNAPTIHAVPVGAAPLEPAGARRRPLWLALAAVGLAAVVAVLAWPTRTPDVKPAVVVVAPAPAPVVAATPPPLAVVPPSAPVVAVTTPPPLAVVPPSAPMPVPVPVPVPKPVAVRPVPAPVPLPPPAPEEEKLQSLRDLPEAIQRSVPPITFGGYMYSKNPADRLLLIDKTLRHEGEEVAPGLVLEKLLPKAAVMNFKGYRYRVPY
jgi:general secretion pathway protein B